MEYTWFLLLLLVSVSGQACKPINGQDCGACANTYFFDGNCLLCENAKNEYSCEQCKGFHFRQGKCLSCASLTNPGLCKQCRGYFFTEGKCQPCEIASPNQCTLQCPDYFLKKGTCTHCGQATDQLTCKFCPSPFEFKKGKCLQCPKHHTTSLIEYECMSCAGVTNAMLCSQCEEFYFSNNTCSLCRDAKNARQCSLCPGFYFENGTCKHCSEAGSKECSLCQGFTLQGQFCVPCRIVQNAKTCEKCPLYRFSTDRQMCVPCQQRGYFLNQQGFCQHCLTAVTQKTCDQCPGYLFDKRNRTCLKCSQLNNSSKCSFCLNHYFEKTTSTCQTCLNANMQNCLLQCSDSYFFSKTACTPCQQAKTASQCKNCAPRYYWSGSGKCMLCQLSDFFIWEDQCISCADATNDEQCSLCRLYTFKNGKCKPCKYANSREECSSCQPFGYYFSDNQVCSLCTFSSESDCNSINCPSYGYFNGSCLNVDQIKSQATCLRFPFFSWTQDGCKYCERNNQYYNPVAGSCIKCDNLRTANKCSLCPAFFFDQQMSACMSCSRASTEIICSKCLQHAFVQNKKCIPCGKITKQSDCKKCPAFFYSKGQCVSCSNALFLNQCKLCRNYTFEGLTCKRCEQLIDMNNCQKNCVPQGYFPARSIGLCLPCSSAKNESNCQLCLNHFWDSQNQICVNCSKNEQTCSKCTGMYWSSGSCRLCPSNCNQCSNDGKLCLQCKVSFKLTSNSTCQKVCNAQFCHRCAHNSSQICEECKPDYDYLGSNGICAINCMVARCRICKSNSVCEVCEPGYLVQEDGLCRCSIDFCDSCEAIKSQDSLYPTILCRRCILGYSYSNSSNTCNRTICFLDNCRLCQTENKCSACQLGWKLVNKRCQPICNIFGCFRCSSTSTCESCVDNYKLVDQRICSPICNIDNCAKCSSLTTCLVCKDDFSLSKNFSQCTIMCTIGNYSNNGTCNSCQSDIPFCEKCGKDDKNSLVCKQCQPSYFLKNGQCVLCSYITPHCINCLVNQVNFVCIDCAFGYSLVGQRCRKCAKNCDSCTIRGEQDCDSCISGYVYISQSTDSVKCIQCLNNCKKCQQSNITNCLACYDGHVLRNGECIKCPNNCKTCSQQLKCKSCKDNYLLGISGCLIKKISFCKTEVIASNGAYTECILCQEGYYLIEGSCLAVSCSTAEINCTFCPQNQYLSGNRCIQCPSLQNCQSCNPKKPSKCDTCMKNYYLQSNGQCISCMMGCESCVSKFSCKIAIQGYFILESVNLPVKCPIQCLDCQNNYICKSCAKDYVLYRNKCISSQALRLNITLKPINDDWENQSKGKKWQNLLYYWSFYHSEVIKLIGYEDRQDMVMVDAVSVGSITYNLIIDKLSTENPEKMMIHIQNSMNKDSTLKLISYQKGTTSFSQKKTSHSQNSNTIIIGITVLSIVVVCFLILLGIKTYSKKRIAHSPQLQVKSQEKHNQQISEKHEGQQQVFHGSYDPIKKDELVRNNLSDKDKKIEEKAQQ